MSRSFRDRPEFSRGHRGELIVSRWLKGRGWAIIPSYDYSGEDGNKAPRLCGLLTAWPVPDLDVARAGDRKWIEVKTKSQASYYRKLGQWQHGIEQRLWDAYAAVQRETGTIVWLAVYELSTDVLLFGRLDTLHAVAQYRLNEQRHPMVYMPRDAFPHPHHYGVAASLEASGNQTP